jgi:hypothetical protein
VRIVPILPETPAATKIQPGQFGRDHLTSIHWIVFEDEIVALFGVFFEV